MVSLKSFFQSIVPDRFQDLGSAIYWYGRKYFCPICGWHTRAFRAMKFNPDFQDMCRRCGSLARHRLLWLYLKNKKPDFFTFPYKVLHFAPENCLQSRFKKMSNLDYTSADIGERFTRPMEKLDLMAINKPDNHYDVVIGIHVLGHVQDDLKAMREILRVLKPGGWAILNSPMDPSRETTMEVSHDHTIWGEGIRRVYGKDFQKRLEKTGFEVQIDSYLDEIPKETIEKYFLHTSGLVFLCNKRQIPFQNGCQKSLPHSQQTAKSKLEIEER